MASHDATQDREKGWGWGVDWLYTQYMWVWVALLVLTIVEVFVPEPEIFGVDPNAYAFLAFLDNRTFVIVSLIAMAMVKTWLVAWYYMHLIAEKPAIILVACAPFVFSLFLTIGIFPWAGG